MSNKEFAFKPAPWLPKYDPEVLERVRNIPREEMEYTNENGYSVRVVLDPVLILVQDVFHRIYLSDVNDTPLTMIFPNQWPGAYQAIAEMINRYRVSCRNVHAFAMDEWADEDGNVAPLTYGAGLGYSFRTHFYGLIDPDLRPDVEHWHVFTNENKGDNVYSSIIEEVGGGGADVVYSATGWPGHTAFIDPGVPEFHADSLEEYCKLGSRLTTETPLTICENSLFAPMGASGDVWAVPPRAVTIGPRDIVNARERFEVHNFVNPGGDSWQRMISRIQLYGPITMECPATIMRLGKGTCYVSEAIARPFASWTEGLKHWEL
ncbi:MAG: 6-phosphogluconolactonase [Christensenellales bacterium]|jgi:glucosamine-6-phosphate deaminase